MTSRSRLDSVCSPQDITVKTDMNKRPGNRLASGARGARSRPWVALALLIIPAACVYLLLQGVQRLPNMPYNVLELFPSQHRPLRIVAFTAFLAWMGSAPVWLGDFFVSRPGRLVWLPVGSAIVGLAGWPLLRMSVTTESILDVLGTPTLGWGWRLELIVRFVALQAVISLMIIMIAFVVGGIHRLKTVNAARRGIAAAFWGLPALVLAWLVIVPWAGTDNVTELIRRKPFVLAGAIPISAAVALIVVNSTVLAYAWRGRGALGKVISLALIPLLIGPCWALVYLGLEPAVSKYGQVFPAISFLLAADRVAELPWIQLFLRWSAFQVAAVLALGWAGLAALHLRPALDCRPPAVGPELAS